MNHIKLENDDIRTIVKYGTSLVAKYILHTTKVFCMSDVERMLQPLVSEQDRTYTLLDYTSGVMFP